LAISCCIIIIVQSKLTLFKHFKVTQNTIYTFNLLDKRVVKDKVNIVEAGILTGDDGSLVSQAHVGVIVVESYLAGEIGHLFFGSCSNEETVEAVGLKFSTHHSEE
jgi:hypothetical protein